MEDKKITAEELKAALSQDMDQLADQIVKAMNTARVGRIIDDSEEPVRDAHAEFRQKAYQKAVDLLCDKLAEKDFSPSQERNNEVAE